MSEECHDCGVSEGQIHHDGCDMERCPFCGRQLISCSCIYKQVSVHSTAEFSQQEIDKWFVLLREKGRVPYIVYPNICARCGKLWPEMFSVPDEEWEDWEEVSAKVGGQNITDKMTIEGQLGPPGYYELIVDNRQNSDNAGVNIDLVVTLPGYSALLSFLALIPLVIFLKKKKIKKSIR